MYLRRLEIAGFKSFGDRVKLDLEPGISAIVGPNGSGKSNIAEAIRWVLGERAGRSLRTAKTEDLIFSGTEKGRAKASLAEVSLVLSGQVGEDLDYEELKISRKLYRSGESEYRLNGRKCLARDLAKILAQAGFGTSSYTVIGQGMVDNLIIASPAERKLLFEEASGIRGFELERTDVLVRLRQTQEQVQKLRNEALELVPERDRISQDVDRLGRRKKVASELKLAQQYFLQQEIMRVEDAQKQLNNDRSELEKEIVKLDLAEKGLRAQAQKLADNSQQSTQKQTDLIQTLADLDNKRSQLSGQITQVQVELELKKAELNSKNSQSWQVKNKTKLQSNLKALQKDLQDQTQKSDVLTEKVAQFDNKIRDLTKQLAKLRQALRNNQRAAYIGQALGLARLIARQLTEDKAISSSQLRILLHKLIRTVKLAHDSDLADAPDKIAKLQQQAAREMAKKEEVVERQTTIIIRIRSLELDIHAIEKELESNQLELPNKLEEELLQRIKVQEEKLTKLCAEHDRYEVEQEKLRGKLAELSHQDTIQAQVEIAHQLEEVVQQGKMKQDDRSRIDTRCEDLEQELKQLSQQAKTWRVEIGDRVKTIGEQVNRDTITRLEAELTLIGEIDEAVVVAYGQLHERIAYLEDQAQDIERAIADLEKVLDELTRRIQSTFAKNFARINRSFAKHFAQLFSGGTAELTLLQLDDDYGIEITVQPPGKRVATLSALSGGEKALSAIALLSAILSVNPSPFIVLDEVDAALDDRNALLFCQTLKQLAKKSQILVITHNHETMVQSDKLFGVTASPRTASTVLAVELAEAEAVG